MRIKKLFEFYDPLIILTYIYLLEITQIPNYSQYYIIVKYLHDIKKKCIVTLKNFNCRTKTYLIAV